MYRPRAALAVALAPLLAALLALTACTSSTPTSAPTSASTSVPTSAIHDSPAGTAGTGTGTTSSASGSATAADSAAVLPSSAAQVRTFVLQGARVASTTYTTSADQAGEPQVRDRFGNLTFETPSGNISCQLRPAGTGTTAMALCWVQQLAQRAARPASCTLEWVPGVVTLTGTSADVGSCRGDEPFARYATVLPYGDTLVDTAQDLACRSDPRFVACVSLHGGAAFLADRTEIHAIAA